MVALDDFRGRDACVSDEEREYARRLRQEVDRIRYLAAHAALRTVLAGYAACATHDLQFAAGPQGKPRWNREVHGNAVPDFNLSHSGAWAVLALSSAGEVGVDVETRAAVVDPVASVDLLSPAERAFAARLDADAYRSAFLVAWTRKEACLKALGSGFSLAAREVDAGMEASPRAVLLQAAPGQPERTVHVLTMPVTPERTISIARLDRPIESVRTFTLP